MYTKYTGEPPEEIAATSRKPGCIDQPARGWLFSECRSNLSNKPAQWQIKTGITAKGIEKSFAIIINSINY